MRNNIYAIVILLTLLSACRKGERITTDPSAMLSFEKDSILFDTIFTSTGSIIKRIKIYNRNRNAINIEEIKLTGADGSPFSININGTVALERKNIIINGKDSISLYIKVTINPNSKDLAFLIQDSISIYSNGNKQMIRLSAYGQNATFVDNLSIGNNTTWNNTLPYVVNGSLTIQNGASLTIQPGTKIYFHKDANLKVEGNLNINGTSNAPVLLCSDRLESIYTDEPGQWEGIFIKRTGNGMIKNAVIKNASVGITSDSLSTNTNPKLILSHSIVKNMQVAAYIGNHSELLAFNNLMYNCGNYLIYAIGGGNYNLKQNTLAGFNPNFPRKTAALSFSDYLAANAYNKLQVDLVNNIIWGNLSNELEILKKTSAVVQSNVTSNLIKSSNSLFNNNGNVLNTDPGFISVQETNFKLQNGSVAAKKGINLSSDNYFNTYLSSDLQNTQRFFPSSLGCYEIN